MPQCVMLVKSKGVSGLYHRRVPATISNILSFNLKTTSSRAVILSDTPPLKEEESRKAIVADFA